ncbi:MAG: hypothetical protein EBV19_06780 [Flavobacteriia bacterium]|nr:hypothetical protein [Flavobacteriia bacterium]
MIKTLQCTLLLIVFFALVLNADKPVYIAGNLNGHGYEIIPTPMPWHLAKKKANDLGGYLVTISSTEENEFVISLINKATKGEMCEIWIGFNDERNEGDWKWVNDEKATYNFWHKFQPDNWNNGENAAVFVKNDQGYCWNDRATDTRLPFIVEFNSTVDGDNRNDSGDAKSGLRSTR